MMQFCTGWSRDLAGSAESDSSPFRESKLNSHSKKAYPTALTERRNNISITILRFVYELNVCLSVFITDENDLLWHCRPRSTVSFLGRFLTVLAVHQKYSEWHYLPILAFYKRIYTPWFNITVESRDSSIGNPWAQQKLWCGSLTLKGNCRYFLYYK